MINYYLVIALMLSLMFGGYEHLSYKQYRTEVEAAGKAQQIAIEGLEKQRQIATKGVEDVYKTKIDAIRSAYGVHNTNSGAMPAIPNTTLSLNEPTTNTIFIEQCTETTQQVVSLQDWIKLQVEIK